LRDHSVGVAVSSVRTSATDLSRHPRHMSQDIGDTVDDLDAQGCPRRDLSSQP
jgi:hypothetical protein